MFGKKRRMEKEEVAKSWGEHDKTIDRKIEETERVVKEQQSICEGEIVKCCMNCHKINAYRKGLRWVMGKPRGTYFLENSQKRRCDVVDIMVNDIGVCDMFEYSYDAIQEAKRLQKGKIHNYREDLKGRE